MVWIIIIAVIVLLVLWFISTSNRLAKLKMKATTAFADVDTYLTQRYDVIKSMEGTIKGATKNEKNIFKEVIEARSAGLNAKTIDEKIDADNKTTQALMNFVSLTESYPELSSIKEFNTLLGPTGLYKATSSQLRGKLSGYVFCGDKASPYDNVCYASKDSRRAEYDLNVLFETPIVNRVKDFIKELNEKWKIT